MFSLTFNRVCVPVSSYRPCAFEGETDRGRYDKETSPANGGFPGLAVDGFLPMLVSRGRISQLFMGVEDSKPKLYRTVRTDLSQKPGRWLMQRHPEVVCTWPGCEFRNKA